MNEEFEETFDVWLSDNGYQDDFLKYEREVWNHQQEKINKLQAELDREREKYSKCLGIVFGLNDYIDVIKEIYQKERK